MRWWTGQSGRSWNDEAAECKKLVLLNLPYFLLGLFATNLTRSLAAGCWGGCLGQNALVLFHPAGGPGSWWPSLHPLDLAVGLCCGAGLRLAVYLHGKNAKKYRHNVEYGSARCGHHDDIAPYIDPVFQNNVILTQTERLTMSSRPKNPKYARNKNVLVIGGSGSGKDPLLAQAQSDADAQFLCGHRPKGHHPGGVRQKCFSGRA